MTKLDVAAQHERDRRRVRAILYDLGVEAEDDPLDDDALDYHRRDPPGKVEIATTKPTNTQRDLSLAYSPGVAAPCRAIDADPDAAYEYTTKRNLVGVVSNGTAVLGLGDIGAQASKPVMEGKGALFKRFADIDGETSVRDRITYRLPVLGDLPLATPSLAAMLWYRHRRSRELLAD